MQTFKNMNGLGCVHKIIFGAIYKEVRHQHPGEMAISRAFARGIRSFGVFDDMKCLANLMWIVNIHLVALAVPSCL